MLWDVDYTLLDAGGSGREVYRSVFRDLFGRDPDAVAPMGGRTERAIIASTLSMSGISDPARHVDEFIAELTRRAPELQVTMAARGHALPGAAAALAAVAALGPAVVQSVLTGNVPAMARAKLAAVGLDAHLDLDVGAYGDHHEIRAELVHLARARAHTAYGREFVAFWLRDGAVVAGMNVNVWDVSDDIQALIRSAKKVDPARLTDPDIPIAEV